MSTQVLVDSMPIGDSMPTSAISLLAQRIAANTAIVDDYLNGHNLPQPSFAIDAPLNSVIPESEFEITKARQEVISDTLELRRLLLGPREYLTSYNENDLVSQLAVVRFGLAHAFPVEGEVTFGELASKVGLGETHVKKLVRHAITKKIFREPRPGVIAHSACSRLIAEDDVFYSFLQYQLGHMWPAALHLCDAIEKWPGSEEPNQCGFSVAHNTEKSMFAWLSDHPKEADDFYKAMRDFAQRPGLEPKHVVEGHPWASLPDGATVVDVGGSHGMIAIELARTYPALNFVVQDIDEDTLKDANAKKPADIGDRVRFMAHDFMTPQPINAAVYFFRTIFHDWPDKYCIKILRQLIPALKPGARIIINELVMPDPGTVPWETEAKIRQMDLSMLAIGNSGERDLDEWRGLFEQADKRFVFRGVSQPPGSRYSLLEAEWMGETRSRL